VKRVFDFFSSIKVASGLLILLILTCLIGSLTQIDIYHSPFFMGILVLLSLSIITCFSALLLPGKYKEIIPLVPALQSYWLFFHVALCFLAYGSFAVSFGVSLSYLFTREVSLDELTYRSIAIGFVLLALGIITGAVWAHYAWGAYWSWDPKETWALITWLIYALYLHLRAIGWRKKRSAWLAIIGFFAVIFTYLGVNFLLPGLHSYM
jgi:ABC-type transport system involved in cytochrome c biogenesis permease subunit